MELVLSAVFTCHGCALVRLQSQIGRPVSGDPYDRQVLRLLEEHAEGWCSCNASSKGETRRRQLCSAHLALMTPVAITTATAASMRKTTTQPHTALVWSIDAAMQGCRMSAELVIAAAANKSGCPGCAVLLSQKALRTRRNNEQQTTLYSPRTAAMLPGHSSPLIQLSRSRSRR